MLRTLYLVAIEGEQTCSLRVEKGSAVLFVSAEVMVLGLDFRISLGSKVFGRGNTSMASTRKAKFGPKGRHNAIVVLRGVT